MRELRPLFEKVAEWLADYLERFARLIGYPVVPPTCPGAGGDRPSRQQNHDLRNDRRGVWLRSAQPHWMRLRRRWPRFGISSRNNSNSASRIREGQGRIAADSFALLFAPPLGVACMARCSPTDPTATFAPNSRVSTLWRERLFGEGSPLMLMGEVERSLCYGNILCFSDQLRWETNPARQDTLKRLLLREENRFPVSEESFRIAERKLMDGAWLIAREKQLITEIKSGNGDTASAERTLRNLEIIQGLFERLRNRAMMRGNGGRPGDRAGSLQTTRRCISSTSRASFPTGLATN
jgi:hypothetical protein